MYQILRSILLKQHHINSVGSLTSHLSGSRFLSAHKGPVTENLLLTKLREQFPSAKNISVEDTSGGCGAMFNVVIESLEFQGLSVMKQHRRVYDALYAQIKEIHGIHLETRVPKS